MKKITIDPMGTQNALLNDWLAERGRHLLPVTSRRGLLGAELTRRCAPTGVGVTLKEAWRAILAPPRTAPAFVCVASGRVTAAPFTPFPAADGRETESFGTWF